jgi:hypothetical protein
VRPQKHRGPTLSSVVGHLKRLGLHYIAFLNTQIASTILAPIRNLEIAGPYDPVTNLGQVELPWRGPIVAK